MKELLEKIVNIDTRPGNISNFHKTLDLIDAEFNELDVVTRKYVSNDIPSLVVTGGITKHPKILLQGHIDTVDVGEDSFEARIQGNRMYGRGISDMKGMVVAMVSALKEVYEKDSDADVGLMITTDEEVGGFNGVGYLVEELGYRADVLFLPDGGRDNWQICLEEKGIMWLHVRAEGKTAHGSSPWSGVNANEVLFAFHADLSKWFMQEFGEATEKDYWKPTMNVGIFNGGQSYNAVPETAEMKIDIRFPFGEYKGKIERKIKELSKKYKVSIDIPVEGSPTRVTEDNEFLRNWVDLYVEKSTEEPIFYKTNGGSDGRFFGKYKIPIISVKPRASEIHIRDEWVDLEDLEEFKSIIVNWIERSL